MRRSRFAARLCLCFFLLLAGCQAGAYSGEPGIEGYVVGKEEGRILVVSAVPEKIPTSSDGSGEYYEAIWFSRAPARANVGDKVKVWYEIVMTSYPGQSEAVRVVVQRSAKPAGADLSEADAIRTALERHEGVGVPIVKRIGYDADADVWSLLLKTGEDEQKIRIADRPVR